MSKPDPRRLAARALSVGPALPAGPAKVNVRASYASTILLEVEGCPFLVALTTPAGADLPYAVALRDPIPFADWPVGPGDQGLLGPGSIELAGPDGEATIDLSSAERLPAGAIARNARLGAAYPACLAELEAIQAAKGCGLRLGSRGETADDALGEAVSRAARRLVEAAGARDEARVGAAASALVGLGRGLTPSGDDFLCGFLAAARSAAPAADSLMNALRESVLASLASTNDVSASLLRLAAAGQYPRPLLELASSLAYDDAQASLAALASLCGLGHSSGADLASGFLAGLGSSLAPVRAGAPCPRGIVTIP